MKKIIITENQLKKVISTLNEIDEKYLNFLLDKVSKNGIDSLDPLEKDDLKRLSNNEDFSETSILRFTAAKDASIIPRNRKYTLTGSPKHNLFASKICGDAEELAGNDIPIFFEGNLSELDKPVNKQHIKMFIPGGEYDCVSILDEEEGLGIYYCLFIREEYMKLTGR